MKFMIFMLGMLIGSFLGVVIDRLPAGRNIAVGRSECDNCHTQLRPLDLIPIVSFALSQGQCRHCRTRLSLRYPLIEVLTGFAFLMVYNHNGSVFEVIFGFSLASVLIVVAMIDFDTMYIYDRFHIILLLLGIVLIANDPSSIKMRLLGTVIVSIPYLILAIITQGIGGGDVKLIAAAGLVLGAPNTVVAFIISTLLGGIVAVYIVLFNKKKAKDAMPFGPYLCIGIFTAFLFGNQIINYYINLF